MDATLREAKLAKLIENEGYGMLEQMAEAIFSDSVSPAICVEPGCEYTVEMEPDQDAGYCEACGKNTVKSALVLAEIV